MLALFWHTSVQFYKLIDPIIREQAIIRRNYRYNNENYYGGYNDRGHGGRSRRGRGYVLHEEANYGDIDMYNGRFTKNDAEKGRKKNTEAQNASSPPSRT